MIQIFRIKYFIFRIFVLPLPIKDDANTLTTEIWLSYNVLNVEEH